MSRQIAQRAPFNNMEEIAVYKQRIRRELQQQEERLVRDMDAYQDDVDTMKGIWSNMVSVGQFAKNINVSHIVSGFNSVRNNVGIYNAVRIGFKFIRWLKNRKRK